MQNLPFYRLETNVQFGSTTPQCFASFQFIFLLQGNATVQVQQNLLHLKEHDFAFFNLYELHQFIYLSPEARFLLVQISEDYLNAVIPELLSCSFHTHTVSPDTSSEYYEYFCREFGNFIYQHTVRTPGSQLQALSRLGNVLTFILNHMTNKSVTVAGTEKNERLYQALLYVNEHYTSDLTLPDIAAHVGVHPQYFSRYFKQHVGMSLTEYINQLRIVTSLSEIMNTDHTLLDIALNCGFNNYKTYSIAFKKFFHTTPQAWKKEQKLLH